MQGLLEVCHELIERLEAHLTADKYYSVIANMRGESAEEVSLRLLALPGLAGLSVREPLGAAQLLAALAAVPLLLALHVLCCRPCNLRAQAGSPHPHPHPFSPPARPVAPPLQGPTVSPVYTLNGGGAAEPHFFAATICVPKKQLYPAVKEIRRVRRLTLHTRGKPPAAAVRHVGRLAGWRRRRRAGAAKGDQRLPCLHLSLCSRLVVGAGGGVPVLPTTYTRNRARPCPPPNHLFAAAWRGLPQVGGSGVLVQPMTYIFDEEPARWRQLLENLGLSPDAVNIS